MGVAPVLAAPRLTIRLGAIQRNYQRIAAQAAGAEVGAAVKADAYGLGVPSVVKALEAAGCSEFFVASVAEAIEVRSVAPSSKIYVFNGAMPGTLDALVENGLVPLLISLEQVELWAAYARSLDRKLPAGLHFDTGISRTGVSAAEAEVLVSEPQRLADLTIEHVLSHLASADDRSSTQPEQQLALYGRLREQFPQGIASLANSAGTFRDQAFHFDLVRPGIALYGGAPISDEPNPMEHTVVLEAPILQIKDRQPGDLVGYGATYEVPAATRHVVVPVGYADGFLRSSSNSGSMIIAGHQCPIVGRISMDLIILDAGEVPPDALYLGAPVEVIGETRTIDHVAADCGTISFEIITSLWSRYERVYSDD